MKVRSDSLVVQVLVKDTGQGGGEVKVNPGTFGENGKIPFDSGVARISPLILLRVTTVSALKPFVLVPPVLMISKALLSPYLRKAVKAMCESYMPFIILSLERSQDPTVWGLFGK